MGGSQRTRRAPWLRAITVGYLVWSIGPLVLAIAFSFNAGRSISHWEGFSLQWWLNPDPFSPGLLHDADLMQSLRHSAFLATVSTLVAVPLGAAFALGCAHWRSRVSRILLAMMLLPLALPPLMLGTSLWILFIGPLRSIPFGSLGWFGTKAQVAGLITLYLPLATLVVLARAWLLDPQTEEIAADLGASPTEVVRRVLAPQLAPAFFAACTVVFSSALGEFVVVDALVGSNPTRALAPFLLGARNNPDPIDNAVGTVLALVGLGATAAMVLAFRRTLWGQAQRPLPGPPRSGRVARV